MRPAAERLLWQRRLARAGPRRRLLKWWQQRRRARLQAEQAAAPASLAARAARAPKPKQKRAKSTLKWETGSWWRMLADASLKQPGSLAARKFRRRFRLPYPMFVDLCTQFKDNGWLQTAEYDAVGKRTIPFSLKLLAALRHIGRGVCFDDLEDMSQVSESVLRKFTPKFFEIMATHVYPDEVRIPETAEEIRRAVSMYTRLGLPGAMASTDGVHLCWDRCPAMQANAHKGAKTYPSVVFNVSVRHDGIILHGKRERGRNACGSAILLFALLFLFLSLAVRGADHDSSSCLPCQRQRLPKAHAMTRP